MGCVMMSSIKNGSKSIIIKKIIEITEEIALGRVANDIYVTFRIENTNKSSDV